MMHQYHYVNPPNAINNNLRQSLDLKCTPWVREGVDKKHPLATEMFANGGGVNPLSAIIFFLNR